MSQPVQLGDANSDPVLPYVFIGLGGSGKQILVQLRRLLIEAYGTYELPHMKFLCIDTDLAGVRVDIKEDNPYYGRANFNSSNEQVDAAITRDFLDNIYRNRAANAHILSWFDPVLEKLGMPTHGAAQVRSFGRLAFFQKFHEIRDKLVGHLDAINAIDLQAFQRNHGVALDRKRAQVWVVHSVAGGTGSGMFLDCAFLTRDLARQRNVEIDVRAVSLLPDVWTADIQDRRYANAYAALKELDFFNYARGDVGGMQGGARTTVGDDRFRVSWTPEMYRQNIHLHPPVFDTTYLVGADCLTRNSGAQYLTADKRIHLTQSLADWLFQVAAGSGQVSSMLASNLSNQLSQMVLAAELVTQIDLGDPLTSECTPIIPRASPPLPTSKVFFPTQRLNLHAAHQLAAKLVGRWVDGRDPPGPAQAIGRHESALLISKHGGSSGEEVGAPMRNRLGLNDQNEHTTKSLTLDFERLRQRLEGTPTRDGAVSTTENYNQYGQQYLGDEGIESNRGEYWRDAFLIRLPRLEEELTTELNNIVASYYKTPNARSVHALNALTEIDTRLAEVISSQKKHAEVATENVEYFRARYDKLLQFLSGATNKTSSTVARVAVDQLRSSAEWRLHRIHHNATALLAEKLRNAISRMKTAIDKLDGDVRALEKRLSNAEAELAARIDPCHYQQVQATLDGFDSAFLDKEGNVITPERTTQIELNWYEGDMQSGPWGQRERMSDEMENNALNYATGSLGAVNGGTFDVLKILKDRDGLGEVSNQMMAVAKNSAVRIAQSTSYNGYPLDRANAAPTDYVFLLRSGTADQFAWKAAKDALMAQMPPNANLQETAGPADCVTVIQYKVATPLAMLGGIQAWRETYADYLSRSEDKTERVLHTFRAIDTLSEIVALDQSSMQARLDAVETVLIAVVAQIVHGSWGADVGSFAVWSATGGAPYFDKIELGRLQSFVQRVQARRSHKDEDIDFICSKVEACKIKWRKDPEYCAQLVLLVQELQRAMRTNLGQPRKLAGMVGNGIPGWKEGVQLLLEKLNADHKEAALAPLRESLYASLDTWAIEAPEGSGFRQVKTAE